MRIALPTADERSQSRSAGDLEHLIRQPAEGQRRPCPDCELPCPCSGSPSCACTCSPACPQAPKALSSEPQRFPVESAILPLVYALAVLRVTPPCWSCEGHLDALGKLHKPPRVWFTTRALVYPDLISEYLAGLYTRKLTRSDWMVCLLDCGIRDETVFSIEPRAESEGYAPLEQLQADVQAIAKEMPERVRALARARLGRLAPRQRCA